jgi:hypothetical protein
MRGFRVAIGAVAVGAIHACGQQLGGDLPDGGPGQVEAGIQDSSPPADGGPASEAQGPEEAGCGRADGGPPLAFVTANVFPGDTGGIENADKLDPLCTKLASAAGLPGLYRAWVQSFGSTPASLQGKGAFARPDGKLIFAGPFDGGQSPLVPFNVTERCTVLGDDAGAWTGIRSEIAVNCNQWSAVNANGDYGDPFALDGTWQSAERSLCNVPRHFYCFQAD